MRYIKFPDPVELPLVDGNGVPVKYSLERYMAENVWTHESWRESLQASDAFFRLYEKFTSAFKGGSTYVGVEDADYEILLPIVTQKGVKLATQMVFPLQTLMHPFFAAGTKSPD